MPLSLNEIRKRATEFSKEWELVTDERAEAQSFWNDFFNVFGVSRKRVATFEKPVKKADGHQGYIDLLWKRVVLVEHKSRGKDLTSALAQAKDYFPGLKDEELPRYIIVSNFYTPSTEATLHMSVPQEVSQCYYAYGLCSYFL